MSKAPPPPLKPKPKIPPPITAKKPNISIGKPAISISNSNNDVESIASLKSNLKSVESSTPIENEQITMTAVDSSDSDDEPREIDDNKLNDKPKITPLKSTSSFPPPPVRRNLPPRVASNSTVTTTEINKQSPPVVKRPLPPRHKSQINSKNSQDDGVISLSKRSTPKSLIDGYKHEHAPTLPKRPSVRDNEAHNEEHRPSFLSPKKPSRLDSRKFPGNNEASDNDNDKEELGPPLPMRRNIPVRRSSRQSSYSVDSDENDDDDDDDYGLNNADENNDSKSLRSHSSLLFDSAKKYSKSGYHTAIEKSTPFAKQAKSSIGKWKEKISNSTSSLPDANHEYDDNYNQDDYYNNRRERARSIKSQPPKSLSPEPEIDNRVNNMNLEDEDDYKDDIDKPVTPKRYTTPINGRPLPGMVQKTKPEIPKKNKPAVPPKKQEETKHKPELPPQRYVTPSPPVTPRSLPPSAPPSRHTVSSNEVRTVPPPPPTRSRQPVAPPSRNTVVISHVWTEPDLDLELPSLWFTGSDMMQLPKCFQGLNCQISAGFVGDKQFRTYAFRGADLSTIKLKLTWKNDSPNPLDSLSQDLKFIPPPVATKEMLIRGNEIFGEHVASWCEVKIGQQVGNGECWTLAHDSLQKGCGKHAFISSGLIHGALLYTVKANGEKPEVILPNVTDDIKRGDILQFKSCFFKYPTMTMTYGAPDHTAIVLDVQEGSQGGLLKNLKIIQQNMGGVKTVGEAEIDLGKLKGGDIKIFRPVEKDWVIDLMEVLM